MLKSVVVGPLQVNCYILWDETDETRPAFIIDPGADASKIQDIIKAEKLTPKYILHTHGHFDHVGADDALREVFEGLKAAIHVTDSFLINTAHEHASLFGLFVAPQTGPEIVLKDKQTLSAGKLTLEVMHTPGHSAGSACFYEKNQKMLFTGDTLFAESIGRTDLSGGSFDEIMDSINNKILPLGDDIAIYPGHGPESTIGHERKNNPFLQE